MSALLKMLTGAAGLAAAVGFASPAAAQYYPGYGYGYGYNNGGGVVGAIVNAVTGNGYGAYGSYGYNGYGANPRLAVDRCSRAVQARVGGGYGYGRGVGITSVENRNSGIRVHGVTASGGYGGRLDFTCKVDFNGQITDLEFDRGGMNYGYNGYYRGY